MRGKTPGKILAVIVAIAILFNIGSCLLKKCNGANKDSKSVWGGAVAPADMPPPPFFQTKYSDMKTIPLLERSKKNRGKYFAIVDEGDYEYLMNWKWQIHFSKKYNLYVRRFDNTSEKPTAIRMHRDIMGVTDKNILIDHINGNGLDNRRCNLRIATNAQNSSNRIRRKGASIYKGVYRYGRKKWYATICKNYKPFKLGVFNTEEDAARAYDKKAMELHGEFANLNFKT